MIDGPTDGFCLRTLSRLKAVFQMDNQGHNMRDTRISCRGTVGFREHDYERPGRIEAARSHTVKINVNTRPTRTTLVIHNFPYDI